MQKLEHRSARWVIMGRDKREFTYRAQASKERELTRLRRVEDRLTVQAQLAEMQLGETVGDAPTVVVSFATEPAVVRHRGLGHLVRKAH